MNASHVTSIHSIHPCQRYQCHSMLFVALTLITASHVTSIHSTDSQTPPACPCRPRRVPSPVYMRVCICTCVYRYVCIRIGQAAPRPSARDIAGWPSRAIKIKIKYPWWKSSLMHACTCTCICIRVYLRVVRAPAAQHLRIAVELDLCMRHLCHCTRSLTWD